MDCSPPSSSVHGILQAKVLEWVAISPPGDLPNSRIEPCTSRISCIGGWILHHYTTSKAQPNAEQLISYSLGLLLRALLFPSSGLLGCGSEPSRCPCGDGAANRKAQAGKDALILQDWQHSQKSIRMSQHRHSFPNSQRLMQTLKSHCVHIYTHIYKQWRRKWQPIQYSCLGSPMDREAWWATVKGVAKSQT